MNRHTTMSRNKPIITMIAVALCAILTGCGLRGGNNNQPPAGPSEAPALPTTAPSEPTQAAAPSEAAPDQPAAGQPTQAAAPTQAPTAEVVQDTQGDEIEALLDQLDQANQKADPLDDVPQ